MNSTKAGPRILIVDDNSDIHTDFRKVLCPESTSSAAASSLESAIFGTAATQARASFRLDFALQGKEALELAKRSVAERDYYAMAFVDMRMPPGWDGLRTMEELKKVDSSIQFVVCTAYSDYTPDQVCQRLEIRDGILFIRKPFIPADVRAIATRMTQLVAA